MTVIDWTAVRKQLAANARLVVVNGRPLTATHVPVTKVVSPPVVSVQGMRTNYDIAMGRGADETTIIVRVFAATTDNMVQAVELLDQICTPDGPTSLRAGLIPPGTDPPRPDRTLGGLVQASAVISMERDVIYTVGTQPNWLGAEFVVRVW